MPTPISSEKSILNIDPTLMGALIILFGISLVVLYSATSGDMNAITRQSIRFGIGFVALFALAQIPNIHSLVASQHSLVGGQHSVVGSQHSLVDSRHSLVGSEHSLVGSSNSLVGSQHSLVGSLHSLVGSKHSQLVVKTV